ncbi:MAG: hypothetical protein U0905_13105 [Pirellulales bacterium]
MTSSGGFFNFTRFNRACCIRHVRFKLAAEAAEFLEDLWNHNFLIGIGLGDLVVVQSSLVRRWGGGTGFSWLSTTSIFQASSFHWDAAAGVSVVISSSGWVRSNIWLTTSVGVALGLAESEFLVWLVVSRGRQ